VRGARTATTPAPHLVAAFDHATGTVVGQLATAVKSNEIPTVRTLLAAFDLSTDGGVVVTVDAMHTQTDTAQAITAAGGDYVFTVKANQCATRRSVTSPLEAGQTRREVCWVRWLTWSRKAKGTRACQETDGRVQVPGTACRGTRAVWRRIDLLEPQSPAAAIYCDRNGTWNRCSSWSGCTGSPRPTFAARAMPSEGIQGDEWGACSRANRVSETNVGSPSQYGWR
jgi:predicted transposase YbfD/YdcC